MYTDSFIAYIETGDICEDIAEDVERRFDTSNYELDRSLPKGKIKKVVGLMRDELGEQIMKKIAGLIAKAYIFSIEDGSEDEKDKSTKRCILEKKLEFQNYKNSLEVTQLENKKTI